MATSLARQFRTVTASTLAASVDRNVESAGAQRDRVNRLGVATAQPKAEEEHPRRADHDARK